MGTSQILFQGKQLSVTNNNSRIDLLQKRAETEIFWQNLLLEANALNSQVKRQLNQVLRTV